MIKKAFILVTLTLSLGATGCSSLGELVALDPTLYSQTRNNVSPSVQPLMDANSSKSFTVFNNNPYALHLEFEEADLESYQTPVNGDGGASLNAYAACLTLKVMF